ncbi:MAG: nickel permease [Cyanobacteria bacterium RYN_339]|nr:nickel permease [Cyanobacteria bacterium RYN_339]
MLGLGLRHALDPDHVATVDGIAFGLLDRAPTLAPWVGTLFALGHGAVVTAIGCMVAYLGHAGGWLAAPPKLVEWMPVALLLLVGGLNLRALLAHDHAYRPVSWKGSFLPRSLRDSGHPLMILLTGVAFAFMLDSAATAAAWGYTAAAHGGVPAALVGGLVFSVGMTIAATAYGQAMTRLLLATGGRADAERYRRGVGWATVGLSFGVVGYMAAIHLFPALELAEGAQGALGGAFVAGLGLAALAVIWRTRAGTADPLVNAAPPRALDAVQRPRRLAGLALRRQPRV